MVIVIKLDIVVYGEDILTVRVARVMKTLIEAIQSTVQVMREIAVVLQSDVLVALVAVRLSFAINWSYVVAYPCYSLFVQHNVQRKDRWYSHNKISHVDASSKIDMLILHKLYVTMIFLEQRETGVSYWISYILNEVARKIFDLNRKYFFQIFEVNTL